MVDVAAVSRGEVRAVARALSCAERGGVDAEAMLGELAPRTGRARTLGVTGSPGVGKSSLVEALGQELLAAGKRVAVLAVDPSSPFTGGALLGDRLRMPRFVAAGGFVRSMATRGALGGVAGATADAVDVLDAAGFDWVVVETVGVGQDEVDVATEVETVVVVTVGGMGDDVQAAKAGVMEIASVFAVNKSDRPGADAQAAAIESMLALAPATEWRPPVVLTSAASGAGIADLVRAIESHQGFLAVGGRREVVRCERARRRVRRLLEALVWAEVRDRHDEMLTAALGADGWNGTDPHAAARALLAQLRREGA